MKFIAFFVSLYGIMSGVLSAQSGGCGVTLSPRNISFVQTLKSILLENMTAVDFSKVRCNMTLRPFEFSSFEKMTKEIKDLSNEKKLSFEELFLVALKKKELCSPDIFFPVKEKDLLVHCISKRKGVSIASVDPAYYTGKAGSADTLLILYRVE